MPRVGLEEGPAAPGVSHLPRPGVTVKGNWVGPMGEQGCLAAWVRTWRKRGLEWGAGPQSRPRNSLLAGMGPGQAAQGPPESNRGAERPPGAPPPPCSPRPPPPPSHRGGAAGGGSVLVVSPAAGRRQGSRGSPLGRCSLAVCCLLLIARSRVPSPRPAESRGRARLGAERLSARSLGSTVPWTLRVWGKGRSRSPDPRSPAQTQPLPVPPCLRPSTV